MYPPLRGEELEALSYIAPHEAPLSPKRPRQVRRDSGVFVAMWGSIGRSIMPEPHTGRPYPPNGPGKTARTRVYPALCGAELEDNHTRSPHGASLSPKRPRRDQRDSGVPAAVWGGVGGHSVTDPPTGRPYPPNGQGGTRGTRVYPPMCGEGWKSSRTWPPHGASLSPKRPRQDGRDSGVSVAVWDGA